MRLSTRGLWLPARPRARIQAKTTSADRTDDEIASPDDGFGACRARRARGPGGRRLHHVVHKLQGRRAPSEIGRRHPGARPELQGRERLAAIVLVERSRGNAEFRSRRVRPGCGAGSRHHALGRLRNSARRDLVCGRRSEPADRQVSSPARAPRTLPASAAHVRRRARRTIISSRSSRPISIRRSCRPG